MMIWPRPIVEASSDDEPERGGAWSLPDPYTVGLNVDDRSYRQPLLLKPDRACRSRRLLYQREFELARKVEDATTRASAASHTSP